MANLHLVTGYAGKEHVTSEDHGAFNAALIGTGQFVLKKGRRFEAQVISNNQIRVFDGELMMQGRFVRLNPESYIDISIENGTQGMKRNDLIVVRYTKSTISGVESVALVVIKGTESANNPVDPPCTNGDITDGKASQNDFPLWRIPIDGLNVGVLVPLFNTFGKTIPEIVNEKQEKTDSLTEVDKLDDADAFPFFDASSRTNRKTRWSTIKSFFSLASHKHNTMDITSGIMPLARGGTGLSVNSLSELATALGTVQLVSGSYTGTGASNKTFNFPFTARILSVSENRASNTGSKTVFFEGSLQAYVDIRSGTPYDDRLRESKFDGYTISGCNTSGVNYYYWALG